MSAQEIKNLCNTNINDAVMCGEIDIAMARKLSDSQVHRITTAGFNYDKVISEIKVELEQPKSTTAVVVQSSNLQTTEIKDVEHRKLSS